MSGLYPPSKRFEGSPEVLSCEQPLGENRGIGTRLRDGGDPNFAPVEDPLRASYRCDGGSNSTCLDVSGEPMTRRRFQLLSLGAADWFQLCNVFRAGRLTPSQRWQCNQQEERCRRSED